MIQKITWTSIMLLAMGVAAYAFANLISADFRPQFVQNIFASTPTAISVHLGAGVVALALGAFQLNSRLRAQFLSAHRWFGRVYVVAVMIGGVAGFMLALNSFGGLVTHYGFGLMAVCWMGTTLNAYRHIRNGNVVAHRAWMLRSYAVTFSGVTLRIYLGLSVLMGVAFEASYPVLSWLCWVPNLLLIEWYLRTKPQKISNR